MKIRTRLKLNALISIVSIFFIALSLFYATLRLNELRKEDATALSLIMGIAELDTLTYDYLLYHEKRAKEQWGTKYASIEAILKAEKFAIPDKQLLLKDIQSSFDNIGTAFGKLVISIDSRDRAVSNELRNRMVSRILLEARSMASNSFLLDIKIHSELIAVERMEYILIFVLSFALFIGIVTISSNVNNAIAKPIAILQKGTEIIGSGDLDHKVGTVRDDEIGQLSRAFDSMTDNLKKVTASRDELEHEITGRRRAEEQLIKQRAELEKVNRDLSLLYRVSAAVSSTINLNELLTQVLDTIIGLELLNIEHKGGIFIVEGDNMRLASHLGHTEEFLNLHKGMKVGECLCGRAVQTGEIIISKNSSEDNRHTITYPEIKPHGHIIVPLKAMDRTVGVLYLYQPADFEVDKHILDLLSSIGSQVGIAIENSRLYEETKSLSLHDPLTGLANRRMMDIVFKRKFAMAKRLKHTFSASMLDIDHFKEYNDTHGHSAGDMLLVKIAEILQDEVRAIDLVARYGGEEFFILLVETDLGRAQEVAERIRKTVEETTNITISAGVAVYDIKMQSKEELVEKADSALYQAKQKGRNRVEICGP